MKIIKLFFIFFLISCNIIAYTYNNVYVELPSDFSINELPHEADFYSSDGRMSGYIWTPAPGEPISIEELYEIEKNQFLKITYSRKKFDENWFVLNGIVMEDGERKFLYIKCFLKNFGQSLADGPQMIYIYTPLNESIREKDIIARISKTFHPLYSNNSFRYNGGWQ